MIDRKIFSTLYAHDVIVICFGAILSLLNLIFYPVIPQWYILILINMGVSLAVVVIAYLHERTANNVLTFVHHWYLAPLIFLTFKELYLMVVPIHGRDYDDLFIAIDRWLFGVDPTVWLAQFSTPLATEVLQIAYSSFYFLLILAGTELYMKKDRATYLILAFYIVYGFFLSYPGYFLLPAVGPRFTLHNFDALNEQLPGLFLTKLLRDFVNAGESIPLGVSNPIAFAQRDVFPSGHTMMMLVLMYFVVKYSMKIKIFILVTGTLLIIGTVYLRYHYVIDLVGGAIFMLICIWTAPWLYHRWERARTYLCS